MSDIKKDIYLKYRLDTLDLLLKNHKLGMNLDGEVSSFFRTNKRFGSKDRKVISNILFFYIRNKSYIYHWSKYIKDIVGSKNIDISIDVVDKYLPLFISKLMIDNLSCKEVSSIIYEYDFIPKEMIDCIVDNYSDILSYTVPSNKEKENQDKDSLESIKYSIPIWLFKKIKSYYNEYYDKLCMSFLNRADLIIRVNERLISKEKLLKIFISKSIEYEDLNLGIKLKSNINVSNMNEFKSGYFDIQDLGSQLVCNKIKLERGSKVLDYCAGSGGKTLNLASKYFNQGINFFCHDVRNYVLDELLIRSKRLKVDDCIRICKGNEDIPKNLDYLILDLPCSGTGTLRRSANIKWELTEEKLEDILKLQFDIVKKSLSFLKSGGYLYYITCSILNDENEFQIDRIIKEFRLDLIEEFKTNPYLNDSDGMYLAILRKV